MLLQGLSQDSPWYQQAIFFYLHFQYFGAFFVWMLAVLLAKAGIFLGKKQLYLLVISLILLYAHSLDYNFDHWLIQFGGTLGSLGLFLLILKFFNQFNQLNHGYKFVYFGIIVIGMMNILGSIPAISNLAVENRFILIAWLHLLFLGLYTPFIWLSLPSQRKMIWWIYGMAFIISESALIFPGVYTKLTSLPIMWVLFYAYLMIFLCICWVHLPNVLFKKNSI